MSSFKEARLPESFARDIQEKVLGFIDSGQSFSIIGMSAVGVSPFLRFIASKPIASFIYIDMYELPKFTKEHFLSTLYERITGQKIEKPSFMHCKEALEKLLLTKKQIVIIINKFDLLASEFSFEFFGNIRTLCHVTDGRVSLIFSVNQPYIYLNELAITGSNMHIFSRYVPFHPYSDADAIEMLKLHSPEFLDSPRLGEAMRLGSGHMQLIQLILRSETPTDLLKDPYIRLLFKEIMNDLTTSQQITLKRVAEGKEVDTDLFLENIGIIEKSEDKYQLWSSLFQDFIIEKRAHHLPKKEQLLFQFMKKNTGKILPTEKLIGAVWQNESSNTTTWALDSLIYRLRRHPVLKEKGYSILSHKKLGYQLVKER